jgi:hypothetical protein
LLFYKFLYLILYFNIFQTETKSMYLYLYIYNKNKKILMQTLIFEMSRTTIIYK